MKEVTVRDFREKFTGRQRYEEPVEVKAYGRLTGTWFPPGTLEHYIDSLNRSRGGDPAFGLRSAAIPTSPQPPSPRRAPAPEPDRVRVEPDPVRHVPPPAPPSAAQPRRPDVPAQPAGPSPMAQRQAQRDRWLRGITARDDVEGE